MKLRFLCLALTAASAVQAARPAPEITIPGDKIFPESLTSSADGSVIFGSIGARTVFRAKPGSATAEPWIKAGTDGMRSVLGVFADNKSNTLYACSGGFGAPPPGEGAPRSGEGASSEGGREPSPFAEEHGIPEAFG